MKKRPNSFEEMIAENILEPAATEENTLDSLADPNRDTYTKIAYVMKRIADNNDRCKEVYEEEHYELLDLLNTVNSKRKNKGLEHTVYKRGNLENMIWRETTIRRILRNPIYIGIQKHKFHVPDPANPIPAYKRTDRKVLEEFEISTPETRIISDEDFYQVSRTFTERMANRNQGIKRQTLLKDLLRCGECGSRMCSVTKARGAAYQCAARL